MTPLVHLGIDYDGNSAARVLRDGDLCTARVEIGDDVVAFEGLVSKQCIIHNAVDQRCDADSVEAMAGHQLSRDFGLTHIYQHGDIVFTHAELSRTQKTTALEYISTKLFRWRGIWGLRPYRIVAQGHNHQALYSPIGTEIHYMLPCCADIYSVGMEYIHGSRMVGNPPQTGYVVFYQNDDGNTDDRRTRIVLTDPTARLTI